MNTKDTLNKVRAVLGIEVKLEQMKLENGAILEAEKFEAGAEIFVVADEERVAMPVGEYETEDGMMIIVSEEGIIAEIKEAEAKEAKKQSQLRDYDEYFAEPPVTFWTLFKDYVRAVKTKVCPILELPNDQ